MNSSTAGRPDVKQVLWFWAALLLGLVLWHGGLLWGAQVMCGGDLVNNFIPMRLQQQQYGWFAGWAPETFSGRPLLGDIQTAAFYPLNWLHLTGIAPERVVTYLAMLHLAIGATGFFVFARRKFDALPAAVAAMLWTFGGYQLLRFTNGVVLFNAALAWVPWMLWCVEKLPAERGASLRPVALLGLFGGLQLLAGAPQMAQITWVGLGVWLVGRCWSTSFLGSARLLGAMIVSGLIALLLAAPALAETLRFQAEAFQRGASDPWKFLIDGSLERRLILTWFFPELFGSANREDLYWGSSVAFQETNMFLGIGPWILGLFAVMVVSFRNRQDAPEDHRWVLSACRLGLLGFLIALGSQGFLFRLLVDFVPTFNLFRVPARWMMWIVVALCILTAAGLQYLRECQPWPSRLPVALWMAAGAAVLVPSLVLRGRASSLLDWLNIRDVLIGLPPSMLEEKRALLQSFAVGALEWSALVAAGTLVIGLLLLFRRWSVNVAVWFLLLLMAGDLYRFWMPFTETVPNVPSPEVATEVPFHRIEASRFREFFYPQTPMMKRLHEIGKEGRIHYDNSLIGWAMDQFQRELLTERPSVQGLEITRGYQQLTLAGYVQEYYQSLMLPPEGLPGAFLSHAGVRNLDFFHAYNVRTYLTYQDDEGMHASLQRVGLQGPQVISETGMLAWFVPMPRGWIWISDSRDFLRGEPSGAGLATLDQRTHDRWAGRALMNQKGWLHLSSPDSAGWELDVRDMEGNRIETLDSRSVWLPGDGLFTFERRWAAIGLSRTILAIAGAGLLLVLILLGVGKRTTV